MQRCSLNKYSASHDPRSDSEVVGSVNAAGQYPASRPKHESSPNVFQLLEPGDVELFSGIGKEERQSILAAAVNRSFKTGDIIVRADDVASHLFLIKRGAVDFHVITSDGKDVLLGRLVHGDIFGVAAFLSTPAGYLGTAQAAQQCEILSWPRRIANQLARVHPDLAENALRTALRYLARYVKRHISLVSNTASERLASTLASLGARAGHAVPDGIEIDIKNEDLASLSDVGFFTTSRLLSVWQREGVLEKARGKVVLRCPEKLVS